MDRVHTGSGRTMRELLDNVHAYIRRFERTVDIDQFLHAGKTVFGASDEETLTLIETLLADDRFCVKGNKIFIAR